MAKGFFDLSQQEVFYALTLTHRERVSHAGRNDNTSKLFMLKNIVKQI